jgi:NAD(P)H dehydrogenase (quinone)
MTTYAVTGATGQLGRLAVLALLDRDVPASEVVAIVRNAAKAQPLVERGVQVRVADYDDAEALVAALTGVDRLLFVSGSEVGRRERQHRAVVEAAKAAKVSRIAYTSIARAEANSMPLGEEHRATEALLRDSGIATLLLRNSWYVEGYTDQLPQYLASGAIIGAAGDARIAAAPRADYAEAAAAALVGGFAPGVYELGGPAFSMSELAAAISAVAGRELPYRNVSLEEFEAGLVAAGLDAGTAAFVTALERGAAAGELDVAVTDLERLLGRPATGLATAVRQLIGGTGVSSRADVATATPQRYAKQLVSHLGRKLEWSTDGAVSTARIGDATASVIVGDGVLTLTAAGDDPAAVAAAEDVLGRHLERFGARNELTVSWTRGSDE